MYKVSFILQNPFKGHRSKTHWWFLANSFIIPVKENAGNESNMLYLEKISLFYSIKALITYHYGQICVFDSNIQFYLNK